MVRLSFGLELYLPEVVTVFKVAVLSAEAIVLRFFWFFFVVVVVHGCCVCVCFPQRVCLVFWFHFVFRVRSWCVAYVHGTEYAQRLPGRPNLSLLSARPIASVFFGGTTYQMV